MDRKPDSAYLETSPALRWGEEAAAGLPTSAPCEPLVDAGQWDYLVLTASNERQAAGYRAQLDLRCRLGLLAGAREAMVVPDPDGRRLGSGGSTVLCLQEILNRELGERGDDPSAWQEALSGLRVLIIHGGGDSRRLPAYGPCGKVFVPVPSEAEGVVPATLFDRQLPIWLALPAAREGQGQIVVAAGDVLVDFDPSRVRLDGEGITGFGWLASPWQASGHGVYCAEADGRVRLYLQKPSPDAQAELGALDADGQAILDLGILSLDAAAAAALLALPAVAQTEGFDVYTEICCALGTEATAEHHARAARAAGSRLDLGCLRRIHQALSPIPFRVQVVPDCRFLHFGTTDQIIASGRSLRAPGAEDGGCLSINTLLAEGGSITGSNAWVEGCRVRSALVLGGRNIVAGVDADGPLTLPRGACLDVLQGRGPDGEPAWFVRCYGISDDFKESLAGGATFCGQALADWLGAVGASAEDAWDPGTPAGQRTLWNARLFPAAASPLGYRPWLWMFSPEKASPAERRAWLAAIRYSFAEMAVLADQEAFHRRLACLRAEAIQASLPQRLRRGSPFSAAELAHLLTCVDGPAALVADLLGEARECIRSSDLSCLAGPRIVHSLGTALETLAGDGKMRLEALLPGLREAVPEGVRTWLQAAGLTIGPETTVGAWARRAREAAFEMFGSVIIASRPRREARRAGALTLGQVAWGRAPARLDLGGGWTDTPPYTLEHGGAVINAAVDLNGQPPIHVYGRVIPEPMIRLASIDLEVRQEIRCLDELLDYRAAASEFSLAKAALVLSGLSADAGSSLEDILGRMGGGIELATLAAIPKGSGLGTSSIVGATLLAVTQRLLGRSQADRELFHDVLRLEQAVTTGGGWQDQVGGAVGGVKVIASEPGLVPEVRLRHVPAQVLDPKANGGQTLLYYTGITRLAKNILQQVVGRYLDRDRGALRTLDRLRAIVPRVAEAMEDGDLPAFGRLLDTVWGLNKELDPGATTPEIEAILERVGPHAHGAKLLGAGGGGFLLIVCRSPEHAAALRAELEDQPPNDGARFFDFAVSQQGLVVTAC